MEALLCGSPGAGWAAVPTFERPAECLLGVVPDTASDRGDTEVGGGEQIVGDVHAPFGEVADRRPAQDIAESFVEHRTGHGHGAANSDTVHFRFGAACI